MTHSVDERREIYKQAYDILCDEIENDLCTFICPNLWTLGRFERVVRVIYSIKDEFPEFYAQKPPTATDNDPWWGVGHIENNNRKMALLNAIAACTNK